MRPSLAPFSLSLSLPCPIPTCLLPLFATAATKMIRGLSLAGRPMDVIRGAMAAHRNEIVQLLNRCVHGGLGGRELIPGVWGYCCAAWLALEMLSTAVRVLCCTTGAGARMLTLMHDLPALITHPHPPTPCLPTHHQDGVQGGRVRPHPAAPPAGGRAAPHC